VIKRRVILLSIILIAFFLRFWQLPQTPPGLWYDEAYNAMDALRMAETGQPRLFMLGNNGREPMWHYLLLLATGLLGHTTFAVRLVGALAGIVTIPIMYRFTLVLSKFLVSAAGGGRQHYWFALAATGGLAVSWWHLLNSRAGFRPVLLPPILMLSLYFFWRGRVFSERYSVSGEQYPVNGEQYLENSRRHWGPRFKFYISRFANFILAGFFLGLVQYTYLPARLAPLIFGGLVILWTLQIYINKHKFKTSSGSVSNSPARDLTSEATDIHHSSFIIHHSTRQLLLGTLITATVAALTFAPLGLFFLKTPEAFSARTGDVLFNPADPIAGMAHMLQGLTLFFGAGHELYRHHLPGRAMLGWLEIPFFWLGLIILLRPNRLRRPETQLILLGLSVMWLPALLASPPVHSLRPIGLLPFYYLIVTTGLYHASRLRHRVSRRPRATHSGVTPPHLRRSQKLSTPEPVSPQVLKPDLQTRKLTNSQTLDTVPHYVFPVAAAIFLIFTGLINSFDYFRVWANHPEVYKEYNGPLVDLTTHLIDLSQTHDVIIPFHLYVHPTTRYLLRYTFTEVAGTPPVDPDRPVEMLLLPDNFQLLFVGNIPPSPVLVWLTRDGDGQGQAYVSRSPRAAEQIAINDLLASTRTQLKPFKDKLGRDIALFAPLSARPSSLTPLFNISPLRTINLNWAGLVELQGYDVTPPRAQPGQPIILNFYWHSLTEATFDYRLFLQLIDGAGNPVNQLEDSAFNEDMYRWRWAGVLPTQHTLWLGPETAPGPYLIRLGFFEPITGKRLPLSMIGAGAETPAPIDQVQLGLFYVSPDGSDPHRPVTPLSANFADSIQLAGVTLPPSPPPRSPRPPLPISFHWQALQPTDKPYTVFLQLLNETGEVLSGWDSQPMNGLYPTNLWSPGESISDTFLLPLPDGGLSSGTYRLVTGFYEFDTGQRLSVVGGGDFAELGHFVVE
jgi:hypothetical protein